MKFKKLKYILIVCLFISCSQPKPNNEEIIGVWESSEGVTIELKKDYSIRITDYPLSLNNRDFKGVLNGNGTWKIYKDKRDHWWSIQISAQNDRIIPELQSNGIAVELLIARSGLLGNGSEITSLFIWKGDPDADNRYEFKKQ